jgi:NAD-dependent dihydropyrimidine dehydrogenase PreA subunit
MNLKQYRNSTWVKLNSLSNPEKRELVFLKMEFWGIKCKSIYFQCDDALMFTINSTEYTVIVDEYECGLKVLAQNKLGNKSGHRQHYIRDRKTNKHLVFKGSTCWDDLIRWAKKIKDRNKF